jgi:chromosome segregation ATPase
MTSPVKQHDGSDELASIEEKVLAAERAAAPPPDARAAAPQRALFHRTTNWSAEQQWEFNHSIAAALLDAVRAVQAVAGEQRARLADVAQEIGAVLSGSERLHELQRRVQALEAEVERAPDAIAELRESTETLRREHLHRVEALQTEQRTQADRLREEQQAHAEAARAGGAEQVEQLRSEYRAALAQLANDQRLALEQLANEYRERIQHLLEEQRVCIRQLSLQESEKAVLADRARRATEARLDELAAAGQQLGATKRK